MILKVQDLILTAAASNKILQSSQLPRWADHIKAFQPSGLRACNSSRDSEFRWIYINFDQLSTWLSIKLEVKHVKND